MGAAAHLIGDPTVVFTRIRSYELEDLQANQLILNEGFVLPATSQYGVNLNQVISKGGVAAATSASNMTSYSFNTSMGLNSLVK